MKRILMLMAAIVAATVMTGQAQAQSNKKPPPGPPPPPPGKIQSAGTVFATGVTISVYPGDDGDLEKGTPLPDPRFLNPGDGTVIDRATGLVWLRAGDCFGARTWTQALDLIRNFVFDGRCGLTDGSQPGDWRMPNVRELLSLVDYRYVFPALPPDHPFVGLSGNPYFSSTPAPDDSPFVNPNQVWDFTFEFGRAVIGADRDGTLDHVLPVRDQK